MIGTGWMKRNSSSSSSMERVIPEEIIIHIISYLPITDAIRTSLVSPKWTHLWKSVHSLNFDGGNFQSKANFKKYINMVYRATMATNSNLETYRFVCSHRSYGVGPDDSCHVIVNQCIAAAIKRKVKNLEIDYMVGGGGGAGADYNYGLGGEIDHIVRRYKPQDLFFSPAYDGIKTDCITKLSLRTPNCFSITDSKFLSSVRILRLSEITIESKSHKLDLSFPVLEELSLINCKWKTAKSVNVFAPMLSNFSKADGNKKNNENCKFRIHDASLKRIEYTGNLLSDYDLGDISGVTDADIDLLCDPNDNNESSTASSACRFLTQFLSIKNLSLSTNTIEVLSRIANLERSMPSHNNAFCLTIKKKEGGLPLHFQTFVSLQRILPAESLVFDEGVPISIENFELQGANLSCSLPNLKVVKFEKFNSDEREIMLAKFLMKHAPNLMIMSTVAGRDLKYCANKRTRIMSPEELAAKKLLKERFNFYDAMKHFIVQFGVGICWCSAFTLLVSRFAVDR